MADSPVITDLLPNIQQQGGGGQTPGKRGCQLRDLGPVDREVAECNKLGENVAHNMRKLAVLTSRLGTEERTVANYLAINMEAQTLITQSRKFLEAIDSTGPKDLRELIASAKLSLVQATLREFWRAREQVFRTILVDMRRRAELMGSEVPADGGSSTLLRAMAAQVESFALGNTEAAKKLDEDEIRQLEDAMGELLEIFTLFGDILHAQGETIDHLEVQLHRAKDHTLRAEKNLLSALSAMRFCQCATFVIIVSLVLYVFGGTIWDAIFNQKYRRSSEGGAESLLDDRVVVHSADDVAVPDPSPQLPHFGGLSDPHRPQRSQHGHFHANSALNEDAVLQEASDFAESRRTGSGGVEGRDGSGDSVGSGKVGSGEDGKRGAAVDAARRTSEVLPSGVVRDSF